MSLVGSLEDLGLADILQIVSLARKSGRLLLRSEGDAGRIILRDGLVRGAAIKGDREDLRGLLVGGGIVSPEDFERASERAVEGAMPLEDAIVEAAVLARDRLESLRREHLEISVLRMFSWRNGEFSFEVRDDVDPEDTELILQTGINTQYLAMEATRLRDEDLSPDAIESADGFEDADVPMFSGESPAASAEPDSVDGPRIAAVDAVALATVESLDARDGGEHLALHREPGSPQAPAEIPIASAPAVAATVAVEVAPEPADPSPLAPVVAMGVDLTGLEWLKAMASSRLPRVHIFQKIDSGIERVRQYLARGVVPLVVVSPRLVALERDVAPNLLERLRSLAAGIPILALVEADAPDEATISDYDDRVVRPPALAPDPEHWSAHEDLAEALCATLERFGRGAGASRATPAKSAAPLSRLKAVSDRLRDPARQENALALALEFAAESFSRVAIFMVREEIAIGMAGHGVGVADEALRGVELRGDDLPDLFHASLTGRSAVRGAIEIPRDQRLIDALGGGPPVEAYVAPIESGTCVAALLYADHGPGTAGIGDTTPLEIVLHETGLALDRTLLERALADAEGRS